MRTGNQAEGFPLQRCLWRPKLKSDATKKRFPHALTENALKSFNHSENLNDDGRRLFPAGCRQSF
jgi:hypothetical protein